MPKPIAQAHDEELEAERADGALERFLPKAEVLRITGLSDTTLWRMCRARKFPAPIQISTNRIAWLSSEVAEWQRKLIAAREVAA
jgi:prophage regulatory protein